MIQDLVFLSPPGHKLLETKARKITLLPHVSLCHILSLKKGNRRVKGEGQGRRSPQVSQNYQNTGKQNLLSLLLQ
jgi:hypothetical protein